MFGYEVKSSFISFLIVLFGHIALHRYKRQDITPNALYAGALLSLNASIHSYDGLYLSVS